MFEIKVWFKCLFNNCLKLTNSKLLNDVCFYNST